jgi:hypothetical protein
MRRGTFNYSLHDDRELRLDVVDQFHGLQGKVAETGDPNEFPYVILFPNGLYVWALETEIKWEV